MDCMECLCRKGYYDKVGWMFMNEHSYSQHFLLTGIPMNPSVSCEEHSNHLQGEVKNIESKGIIPCVTAWCCECNEIKALCHSNHVNYGAAMEDVIKRYMMVDTILEAK